ncbi:MAG: flavin reductase family protein [Myxococcales bacterium]
MFYETRLDDHGLPADPLKALVIPRPIGWISTRSKSGQVNLAPYSFFNMIHDEPPIVLFSSGGLKDSAAFAIESGEFVVNLVSEPLMVAANASAVNAPRGESEFAYAKVTEAPARLVGAPRVAEAMASLECKVTQSFHPRTLDGSADDAVVVVGQVVGVFIDERILTNGRVDVAKLLPVGRLGYSDFGVIRAGITVRRPKWNDG